MTKLRRRNTTYQVRTDLFMLFIRQSKQRCNDMPSYWIRQARLSRSTKHALNERNRKKQTICVFFTLSTRLHPAQPVSVPILHSHARTWRDTSSVVTKVRHIDTALSCTRYAVSRVGNAMRCHHIGYDRRDIHIL